MKEGSGCNSRGSGCSHVHKLFCMQDTVLAQHSPHGTQRTGQRLLEGGIAEVMKVEVKKLHLIN
jgi:hypothetical protein